MYDTPVLFLKEDHDALVARCAELKRQKDAATTSVAAAAGAARLGDHNGARAAALSEEQVIGHQLSEIQSKLNVAQIVDVRPPNGIVKFGSIVHLKNDADGTTSWYRYGSHDPLDIADGSEDRPFPLSYKGPLARAILGKKVDDQASFDPTAKPGMGILNIRILAIK